MLTKTGVKLLDFGLARLAPDGPQPRPVELTSTPTEAAPLTGQGTILGTVPVHGARAAGGQAGGRAHGPVGARGDPARDGDGPAAFEGPSQASLIAAILEREPAPLATLQPLTPPALERLVRRCLAKSPDDRWDTAHDLADELRWIAQAAGESRRPRSGRLPHIGGCRGPPASSRSSSRAPFSAASPAGDGGRPPCRRPSSSAPSSTCDPAEELNAGGTSAWQPTPGGARTALAWTPDGGALVFVGRRGGAQQLYVRALDAREARALDGTEEAQAPAVSPDGQWVAFWARGAIRRVPLTGGPVGVVVEAAGLPPTGMACGEDGRVFYDGEDRALWWAQPEGAPTRLTTRLDTELAHGLPHLLPGGKVLLFTVSHRGWTSGDEEVFALVIATGERRRLLGNGSDGRYVAPGHLVFLRQGTLFAVPFDPVRLEVGGTPAPVLNGVAQALTSGSQYDVTRAGQLATSATGTLAFLRGAEASYRDSEIVEVDRQGRVRPLDMPVRSYLPAVGVSPDGGRVAVPIQTLGEQALWLYDRGRGVLAGSPATGKPTRPGGRRTASASPSPG